MRVLVYPHDLAIGGSQLNAIELAAAVNDRGHPTMVFGRPGPLVRRVEELGLRFIAAPEPGRRPSRSVISALADVARREHIDVLHGYEWPPGLETWLSRGRLGPATASVTTVMSMAVAPFLPRSVPLVVGTEQIAAAERQRGRHRVVVIEPPVDLRENDPGQPVIDGHYLARVGPRREDELRITAVCRLAHELKLEGLLTAIEVIGDLALERPVRMIVAGDGPARQSIAERAGVVNARTGRETIVLVGEMQDPRCAYLDADVVLGMGGSALRALAFAKPLVVQGEQGFWALLTPATLPDFQWTGWYGVGVHPADGAVALRRALVPLLDDPGRRRKLGAFGRAVVEERFALTTAAEAQIRLYEAALAAGGRGPLAGLVELARVGSTFGAYVVTKKARRLFGGHTSEDFNRHPVASGGPARRPGGGEVARVET
ncbi:glycosyltransferase [Georgenia yuyongxinii]